MAFVFEDPGQMQELNSKIPIDKISSLPDELLINILNFLPTKYAVITSILSRRWCYLFKEVTHLDFDDSLLFNNLCALNREKSCVSFRDFVFKMLDCLKLPNLTSFRIKCTLRCECCVPESVRLWLSAIISKGIQELDLCLGGAHVGFPPSLFTCKTLCILKLTRGFTALNILGTVCLPCLKILHLHQFIVVDYNLIKGIFSGCPLLQDFIMEPLIWYAAEILPIFSAQSLRKLKLGDGKCLDFYDMERIYAVEIMAPLLQSFHYADKLAKSYIFVPSNYLVEAHLEIFIEPGDFEDSTLSRSARDLIQGVSNAKRLFLSADCIKALTMLKDELPILRNLTTLKIGCSTNPHFTLLRLLRTAPNLEELIFSEGLFQVGFKDKDTVQQNYWGGRGRVVPPCLKTRLKVIEIEHFLGLKEELRIVEYFLSNGLVLEQLIIQKWVGRKGKFKIGKQLKRLAKRWNKTVNFNELFLF
ncbi:F-box/LRR-repeat protein At4g14103-like [Silene latifolia]|uniref:F-box/LRR-repeat protein At4g14103-like n=1 Tax=Silene latifolia TaxID=37657 RepID=UPI003D76E75D